MTNDDDGSTELATRDAESLAPVQSRAPDRYEAQYMQGQGAVLYRAKERAPRAMQALLLLPALATMPALVAGLPGVVAVAFATTVSLLLLALFSVLRVTVSEGQVNVQYGLFGPTIPIAAIEEAAATTYDWKTFGGWGIRRSSEGEWIYNMPGDQGRAVRIVWRDEAGNRKVTLVGSKTPAALAESIAVARSRTLPAGDSPKALL